MNNILKELGYSQLETLSDYKEDISDYSTVIKDLINSKIINKDTGLISLIDFFEINECSYGYDFLSKGEALKLIEKDNLEYDKGDNTYNYSGFLERDLNFEIFNKVDSDEIYVFFSVHIGMDIRCGYSNYFVMRFDDDETFSEFLISRFNLKEIETTTVFVDIEGEACSEYSSIRVVDVNDLSHDLLIEDDTYLDIDTTDTDSEILTDLKELYPDINFGELVEN